MTPTTTTPTFQSQLRGERRRLGIGQREAAKLLDVPDRTYWAWDSGKTVPLHRVTREGALARLRSIPTPKTNP